MAENETPAHGYVAVPLYGAGKLVNYLVEQLRNSLADTCRVTDDDGEEWNVWMLDEVISDCRGDAEEVERYTKLKAEALSQMHEEALQVNADPKSPHRSLHATFMAILAGRPL